MSSEIIVYSFSKCSTCRRAIKWLEVNRIKYDLKDIVSTPPGEEILIKAISQLGNRKLVFNTSGLSYRQLGAATIKAMSDSEALEALNSDGKLIKRPFLVYNKSKVLVGFKEEIWAKTLLN